MLGHNHATRFCGVRSFVSLFWCGRSRVSTAACLPYDEIPERNESRASSATGSAQLFPDQEWQNLLSKDGSSIDESSGASLRVNNMGSKSTKFVICSALNSCAKTQDWRLGLVIHAQIVKIGYEDNLHLSSALVDFYAKCFAISDAEKVFRRMKRHDCVSWTSIISGLSQNGCSREAIVLFKELLGTSVKPNSFTYVSVISSCLGLSEGLQLGSLLHAHVIQLGLDASSFIASSLIDLFSKCGRIDEALLLFYGSSKRDSVLYNSMITGYSINHYGEEALKLFKEMRYENLTSTDHTLSIVLNACGYLTVLKEGKQVHCLVAKMGSECNVFVVSALIDMYSKCGSIDDARFIYDSTVEKNKVVSTSMIMGYAQSSMVSDSLELFDRLVNFEGFAPDHICFTAVLTACNHSGNLQRGLEYFSKMEEVFKLTPQLDQYACMVDLYARNGFLAKAMELMNQMPYEPNYVMWSSLLSSCRVHGEVELGKEAANHLIKIEPFNASHYLTLAHIYVRAGLWVEAAELRKLMQEMKPRERAGWSWIQIDKRAHVFSAGDATHSQSVDMYLKLMQANLCFPPKAFDYVLYE